MISHLPSRPRLVSSTLRLSAAHFGQSCSASPKHRAWNECMHMKCTAGRSRAAVHAVHLLCWKMRALVRSSVTSALIRLVSSCMHLTRWKQWQTKVQYESSAQCSICTINILHSYKSDVEITVYGYKTDRKVKEH